VRASLPDEAEQDLSAYVSTSLKPEWNVEELQSLGLVPAARLSSSAQAALLAIEGEDGREYWLGFDNFYAITRYNRSLHYALAVYQLSREIRSARRVKS